MSSHHDCLASRRGHCFMVKKHNDPSLRERKENMEIESNIDKNNIVLPQKTHPSIITNFNNVEKMNLTQQQPIKRMSMFNPKPLCEIKQDYIPSSFLSQNYGQPTTDIEKQTANAIKDYGQEIDEYQKQLEIIHLPESCLKHHEITPCLRSKMVDWMVEVLFNFKCNEQTFFLAVSLMDRFFHKQAGKKQISELHIIGVTAIFLASKYEDILPLRMEVVHERIAHNKLSQEAILKYEQEMLESLEYIIQIPTTYEFLTRYNNMITLGKEEDDLIKKMALYLAKMSMYDYAFCNLKPSMIAICSIYISIKICEQIRKTIILSREIINKLIKVSGYTEDKIVEVAQKVLTNAQNFDALFPGLGNIKKTNFPGVMQCIQH